MQAGSGGYYFFAAVCESLSITVNFNIDIKGSGSLLCGGEEHLEILIEHNNSKM